MRSLDNVGLVRSQKARHSQRLSTQRAQGACALALLGAFALLVCGCARTAADGQGALARSMWLTPHIAVMSVGPRHRLIFTHPTSRPAPDSPSGGALTTAERLLAKLHLSPGAVQTSRDPTPDHRLSGEPATYPMILESVEAYTFLRAPMSPSRIVAWLEANRSADMTVLESGSTGSATPPTRGSSERQARRGRSGNPISRETIFSVPAEHEKTRLEWLEIYAVPLNSNGSALRVSAVVEWVRPRPRDERIPAGVQTVAVKLRDPEHHLDIVRTLRSDASVLKMVKSIEELQRPPHAYGVRSQCGALLFRPAFASLIFRRPTGTIAKIAVSQCAPTKLWINGRNQPNLEGEASLIQRIADIVRHDTSEKHG